jgi:hypothetical protein
MEVSSFINALSGWANGTDRPDTAQQIVDAGIRDYGCDTTEMRAACAAYITDKAESFGFEPPELSRWIAPVDPRVEAVSRPISETQKPEREPEVAPVGPTPIVTMAATERPEAAGGALDIGRYFNHPKGGQQGSRMGQYVAVPRMLNYIQLPPHGREVYRALCAVADNTTDLATVGYNRLAIEAGMDRTAAVRWVKKLEDEYGLIQTVRRSQDRVHPNTYRILYPKDWPARYRDQLTNMLKRIRAGKLTGGKVVAENDQPGGTEQLG